MKTYEEKICRYALNRIFGFHPATALALLERFGGASALFSMGGGRLSDEVGAGYRDVERINDREYEDAARELSDIEASGARFIGEDDPRYPALLRECRDRPIGLYVRSDTPDEEVFDPGRRYIAVVGTRDISPYGREWCARIVSAISRSPERPVIVSGLAIGTDISAHRKALDCGLGTIAVLPTGIEEVYPHRHWGDARRIAAAPGSALVTDYPPNTAPVPYNFLRRNRIIAGLCEAVILIESKTKGGGMMTARLAASYFRDVLALPGRIGDVNSEGCNALIKDKIAEPVISEDALLASLGLQSTKKRTGPKTGERELVEKRYSGKMDASWLEKTAAVLVAVRRAGGSDIEQLSRSCSLEYRETAQIVSILETDGLINVDFMQRCTINYG